MSGNRAAAEDLAAETWMRLVACGRELEEGTQVGAWLFTVARNLFVSHCRSRLRHQEYTSDLVMLWPGQLPRSPYEQAVEGEAAERLETAMAALPLIYREALLLVGVEQMRPSAAVALAGYLGRSWAK